MALTKKERSERASIAAQARWSKHGDEGKKRQRLILVTAHAKALGYRLVPIDSNEETEATAHE